MSVALIYMSVVDKHQLFPCFLQGNSSSTMNVKSVFKNTQSYLLNGYIKEQGDIAAVNGECHEGHPRNNLINKACITQVSEGVEGRVTKKSFEEFSRIEN